MERLEIQVERCLRRRNSHDDEWRINESCKGGYIRATDRQEMRKDRAGRRSDTESGIEAERSRVTSVGRTNNT